MRMLVALNELSEALRQHEIAKDKRKMQGTTRATDRAVAKTASRLATARQQLDRILLGEIQ